MSFLSRLSARATKEYVGDAEEFRRQQAEAARQLEELRKTPPRAYLEKALDRAGLGSDLRKVFGGQLLIRVPAGNADHCFLTQILSVQLLYYRDLRICVGPISPMPALSRLDSTKPSVLEFQDGKWSMSIQYYAGVHSFPIHVIELL